MSSNEIVSANPASLALEDAKQVVFRGRSKIEEDRRRLTRLDMSADSFGFIDNPYFVESSRSLAIPASFEADEEVRIGSFDRLAFGGLFKCYSRVVVGRIEGATTVDALCLTFDDVTLLPYFERLSEDRLLYVPVLAVDTISSTAID